MFCTTIGTHLSSSRTVFEQFKGLLKKAGLPDVRFHDLRHSSASMLLSISVHPKVVQELPGRGQIGMTMGIYSHVLHRRQQEAINRLNDVLWGGRTALFAFCCQAHRGGCAASACRADGVVGGGGWI